MRHVRNDGLKCRIRRIVSKIVPDPLGTPRRNSVYEVFFSIDDQNRFPETG